MALEPELSSNIFALRSAPFRAAKMLHHNFPNLS